MKKNITFGMLMMATAVSLAQSPSEDYEQMATLASPVGFTHLIQNPGFEESIEGWVNEPGFKTFERATWRGIMDDNCLSGTAYLNLFHNASAKGRIVQTLTGVPNGVYSVKAGVYTNTAGANIFANGNLVPAEVNATQFYTVYALVEDSTLALGYYSTHEKDFWSVVDNFSLTYYGNGDDARQMYEDLNGEHAEEALKQAYNLLNETIETAQKLLDYLGGDYYDNLDSEAEKAQTLYQQQRATLAEVNAEIDTLNQLMATGRQFKETYEELGKMVQKLQESIETYETTCSAATLTKATDLLEDMNDAHDYMDRTTIEEMTDYITRCKGVLELLPLPAFIDEDEKPQDYTNLIQNPGFEDGMEGWTNNPAFNECKPTNWATMLDGTYMTGNYYINLFCPAGGPAGSLHQTITGLPAGKYYAGASVFSNRAGLVFFANDLEVEIPVGPSSAPYGRFFGTYINLAEGETLTIGVRTNEDIEFWGGVDNFTLTRYVKEGTTSIQSVQASTAREQIYTLTGTRTDAVRKGINIVRGSDGKTRKVFIR